MNIKTNEYIVRKNDLILVGSHVRSPSVVSQNVHRPVIFSPPCISQACALGINRKAFSHLLSHGADTMNRLSAVAAAAAVVGFVSIPSPANAHITQVYPLSRQESQGPRYREW